MYQNSLLGPILLRLGFFVLNFYFTIQVTANSGWSLLSILLAMFATRELVGSVHMGQVAVYLKKNEKQENSSDDK